MPLDANTLEISHLPVFPRLPQSPCASPEALPSRGAKGEVLGVALAPAISPEGTFRQTRILRRAWLTPLEAVHSDGPPTCAPAQVASAWLTGALPLQHQQ